MTLVAVLAVMGRAIVVMGLGLMVCLPVLVGIISSLVSRLLDRPVGRVDRLGVVAVVVGQIPGMQRLMVSSPRGNVRRGLIGSAATVGRSSVGSASVGSASVGSASVGIGFGLGAVTVEGSSANNATYASIDTSREQDGASKEVEDGLREHHVHSGGVSIRISGHVTDINVHQRISHIVTSVSGPGLPCKRVDSGYVSSVSLSSDRLAKHGH